MELGDSNLLLIYIIIKNHLLFFCFLFSNMSFLNTSFSLSLNRDGSKKEFLLSSSLRSFWLWGLSLDFTQAWVPANLYFFFLFFQKECKRHRQNGRHRTKERPQHCSTAPEAFSCAGALMWWLRTWTWVLTHSNMGALLEKPFQQALLPSFQQSTCSFLYKK